VLFVIIQKDHFEHLPPVDFTQDLFALQKKFTIVKLSIEVRHTHNLTIRLREDKSVRYGSSRLNPGIALFLVPARR
jgi:hypothetical protein